MPEDVSKNSGLVGRLHDLVREHPDFEVLCEPAPYLYCFRYLPNGLAERQEEPEVQVLLDRLNHEIVKAVQSSSIAPVMTTRIGGRVAIRMSTRSHGTLEEDIDATFEAIARWGRLLTLTHSIYKQPTEKEALPCSNEFCSSPMEA